MPRKPKHRYPDKTTIWISKSIVRRLNEISKRGEKSYDKVLERLLNGRGNVWVEILQVDGDSPANHKVLLKLGECIHQWDGERFTLIDPKMVKTVVESGPSG